ncbi:COG1361 S-layer family protein [Candidatus Woesearchaeota archaeon]|nr:COG1361 S-layer family protein [Candidatus Woesearchaeota archaeon]
MKSKIYCIFALAALVMMLSGTGAVADSATYVSGASIRVSMISQDPDPVKPGEYLELRWMVTNYGSKPLEDVEFMLAADYPFQLLGTSDGVKQLGTIQGHQKGEEGVVLYYKVRIDEDSSEGVNKLYLKYRYKGMEDWSRLEYFEVRVRSMDAAVVIDDVLLEPARIAPGSTGKLNIKLKNLADSLMKDVNVKLDLTLESIPRSATGAESSILFDALPFAPTTSASEKRIPSIKPGGTSILSYDLMVYPDAASRVYKLPVIITYKDEVGTEFEKNEIVGVVVGAMPDVYVVIDSSDLIAGKKTGKVSFKFVNKGVTDIKFLDVTLKETADFKITSSNEEYIGNIDSDDFESVDFAVYLGNNGDAKEGSVIEFPLHIEFKDANNVDYSNDLKLTYSIPTAEEKGQEQSRSALLMVMAIVIIVAGWLTYRWWDRRRKRQQKQAAQKAQK